MTTGNKVTPTSTSAQARVMLYQASQRPSLMEADWMETSLAAVALREGLVSGTQMLLRLFCTVPNVDAIFQMVV